MKIYLINVDSARERLAFQTEQFKKIDLIFERLPAITTNNITDEIYREHYYDWQRPLRKSEVACYFSHRLAWEKVLANGQPALILEDDALLCSHTKEILDSLQNNKSAELVTLEIRGRKKYVAKKSQSINKKNDLVRLYQDKTGAAAYIVWPSAAKKLLSHENKKGIALADAHIFSCRSVKSYQIEPAAAIQLDHCTFYGISVNDIDHLTQSSVSSTKKISREKIFLLKRALSQLKLGFINLQLFFKSSKRYILIDRDHFDRSKINRQQPPAG